MKEGNVLKRYLVLSLLVLLFSISIHAQPDESVLVIGLEQEPPTLWPVNVLNVGGYIEGIYARDLWEWDTERQIYPVMVTEIPTADNGGLTETEAGDTRVEITLREGLRWSDGEPITSADCELLHTIRSDRTTSTNYNRGNYPDLVKDFEVLDELSFAITYDGTFADYLTANERPMCRYPAHIFAPMIADGGTLEDSDYFAGVRGTVGYGPYMLAEWNIGQRFAFVQNPFWDGHPPGFEQLIFVVITDEAQMRNAMAAGEVDIALRWSDNLQPLYAEIPDVVTFSAPGISKEALWMRTGPVGSSPAHGGDALQDPLVRQAIGHAIDRRFFVEQLAGPGIPVPLSWYAEQFHPEDLPFVEYDVDRANALLDEAGWLMNADGIREKDGITLDNLRFISTDNALRNSYQLVIQEALAEVGIGTEIIIRPATTLFASFADRGDLTSAEWDLAIFASGGDPLTPTGIPNSYHCSGIPSVENPEGFNPWQFCDPAYDEVDTRISLTPPGAERDALIAEAVRRMHDGYFWYGLRLRNTWYAVNTTAADPESIAGHVGTLFTNTFTMIEHWR